MDGASCFVVQELPLNAYTVCGCHLSAKQCYRLVWPGYPYVLLSYILKG
uniref:Uncharacterized protein n=1 Tax=Anguilla anguilla TaxID=7936 RepID=A0A0E9TWQ6_ANGAN